MLWFLFLQSDGIALRSDDWLSDTGRDDVTPGDAWFNAARTALTALGALGIGGAAYIAYRRQSAKEAERYDALDRDAMARQRDQAERDRDAEGRRQAALSEKRNEELDRQAIERALHDRTTVGAEQLGHEKASIRMAGAYALAAIADDWLKLGSQTHAQAVVNVLTGYVRNNTRPVLLPALREGLLENPIREQMAESESQVRRSVFESISDRRAFSDPTLIKVPPGWNELRIDLRGAQLRNENLVGLRLEGADLVGADLREARLNGASLKGADVSTADLKGAQIFDTDFRNAELIGTDLSQARAIYSDFREAHFFMSTAHDTDFLGCKFQGCRMSYSDMKGAKFNGAEFQDADIRNIENLEANQLSEEQLAAMARRPDFDEAAPE